MTRARVETWFVGASIRSASLVGTARLSCSISSLGVSLASHLFRRAPRSTSSVSTGAEPLLRLGITVVV